MFNRQPPMGVTNNPINESPFSQESSVTGSAPPPSAALFLLSTGDDFLLSTGDDFLLSG